MTEERIVNDKTGGAKGQKRARFDLLPWEELWDVAELYGIGATKYAEHNWRKGYKWGLSMQALHRHLAQFWNGESLDPETKCHHLTSVIFHALAMLYFEKHFPELDDRPKSAPKAVPAKLKRMESASPARGLVWKDKVNGVLDRERSSQAALEIYDGYDGQGPACVPGKPELKIWPPSWTNPEYDYLTPSRQPDGVHDE